MGCKFTSSLVYLWGGGRNFGPHVRTQLKFEYPPGLGMLPFLLCINDLPHIPTQLKFEYPPGYDVVAWSKLMAWLNQPL